MLEQENILLHFCFLLALFPTVQLGDVLMEESIVQRCFTGIYVFGDIDGVLIFRFPKDVSISRGSHPRIFVQGRHLVVDTFMVILLIHSRGGQAIS